MAKGVEKTLITTSISVEFYIVHPNSRWNCWYKSKIDEYIQVINSCQNFVSAIIAPAVQICTFFINLKRSVDDDIFRASKWIGISVMNAV